MVVIEPGPAVVDVMGRDFMDSAVVRDVVRESFLDAGEQLRAVDPVDPVGAHRRASRGGPANPP